MTLPAPPLDAPIIEQVDDRGVRDFSTQRDTPVVFRIDADLFYGVPDVAGELMIDLAAQASQLDRDDLAPEAMKTAYRSQLQMLLTDESAARFIERLGSKTEPISLVQTGEIIPWLMEQYGMRPTEPSEPSATGSPSPDGGPSSTDNAPSPVLPPRAYLQPVSSMPFTTP